MIWLDSDNTTQIFRGARAARRLPLGAIALLLMFALLVPLPRLDAEEPIAITHAHLVEALNLLSESLLERRDPTLDWEGASPIRGETQQTGGRTALALLALVECGRSMQEPNLAESLQRLANRECSGIYAISLRIMLTARLTDRWRALLLYDVERLVSAFNFETSGWGYRLDDPTLRRDNSTTQFAALALRDAAARGVAIPRELWLRLEARFLNAQLADGSWDYAGEGKPRASMTAAAIATLTIVRRTCHRKAYDKGANDRVVPLERSIAAGLAWLDAHFDPQHNHGHSGHLAYYLFAIERACHATGRQSLGEYRWFRAGTKAIFARTLTRTSNNSVNEPTWRVRAGGSPAMPQLALSMLFLSRGLRGDALVYFEGNTALQRPLAAEAMTESLAHRLETRLGWMATNEANTIGMDTPPALLADLHAHPDGLASPDTPLARALVQTARGGGLVILSCNAGASRLRRASEAVLRLLPHTRANVVGREHPLRRKPFPIRKAPSAIEITNGIRTLVVLVGQDCVRDFQRGIDEDDDAGGFLANVLMRAHGGFTPQPRTTTSSNGAAQASSGPGIAHCTADNQAHCEPAALQVCHQRLGGFTPKTCALNELTIDDAPTLVFLSGTEPWEPSEKAWQTIESLLAAGTTIIAETTGGQSAFATELTAHAELHFATQVTNLIDPHFKDVSWTRAAIARFGAGTTSHRLQHIATPHAGIFILANFDLTHGLLGRAAPNVVGWRTESIDQLINTFIKAPRQ